jgi:serine/threonine-protein kinase
MHPASIGPFKIERELGRGGMGVVYLATDTRLDRPVAIKALPADLAADPDRLARFQREAKVLAALNNPNVGGIHGLELTDGQQYLVLEYIEGQTLADRLAEGPISVAESLMLARQIAQALEAAHEKGIVHRDLKPGNVMVTPDGVAKVLDFGLARAPDNSLSSSAIAVRADSPTLVSPARFAHSPTIQGVIMGTAGYMSPEQARGKPVDKRSDIFSFGSVLYEMLTGTVPFRGETVADAIGATLHKESDLSLLPVQTPRRVRELLTNCLAKERKNRLNDIGDARLELDRAINGQEWNLVAESAAVTTGTRARSIAAACVIAMLAGATGWILASRVAGPAIPASAQTFHVSTTIQSKPAFSTLVDISPDSKVLVYIASPELEPDSTKPEGVLVIRRLDRSETIVVDGTEGARNAALSPDGRWVAFSCAKDRASTKFSLKKVAIEGGRPAGKPEFISDLPQGTRFSLGWASDRELVFSSEAETAIYAMATSGSEPRLILREDLKGSLGGWDALVPLVAGQSVLATHYAIVNDKVKIYTEAIELASGKRTMVLPDAGLARLVRDPVHGGSLIVAIKGDQTSVVAVPFDPATLRTIGEPVRVWSGDPVSQFGLSTGGTLALSTRPSDVSDRRLAWLDDQGQPQPIPGAARAFSEIVVSPDGGRVLANLEMSTPGVLSSELWMYDLTRRTSARTPIQGFALGFVWSRDGQRFTHGSFLNDEFSIVERSVNGQGEPVKVFTSPASQQMMLQPSAWSPDGNVLAMVQMDMKDNKSKVLMLEKEPGSATLKATPYLNSSADEHALQFSPDGKWVVFCSTDSGRHELYLQRFTGPRSGAEDARSGRVQISTNGHDGVCWWSADGKEIRFIDSDRQVVSVDVKTEPTLTASLPKVLYSIKQLKTRNFAWAPDGRMMVILQGQNEQSSRIDLVVNFWEEIRAKMGTR